MEFLHFNSFYKSFLQSLKTTNIYKNQLQHNNIWFKILYFISFIIFILSMICLASSSSKTLLPFIFLYIFTCSFFCHMDRKSLKKAVKFFRKKYNMKFIFPDLFDQFKYYLWKEKLATIHSLSSIDKALNYLEIELSKFIIEKDNTNPFYLIILSAITIAAFWRVIEDAHFNQDTKIIIDGLI